MLFTLTFALLGFVAQAAPEAPLSGATRELVDGLMAGRTAPVVARYDSRMAAALPEPQLVLALTALKQQAGEFRGITGTRAEVRGGMRAVVVSCEFANGPVDVTMVWENEKVVGINMRPGASAVVYQTPSYAATDRFTESDVTVDAGGWPLKGTLSMPRGEGPFPGVVLVQGSGPSDRDESLGGPNRVFKDLAWGLASRGIAVLRYDKRTFAHAGRVSALPDFTVKEETIDDALAAAALMRRVPGVRADRVFVAGHSLGGMLAPRIGALDPRLGGLVVLAGAVRPLEDSILSQIRYLAEIDDTVSDAERAQISAAEELVKRARALKPGDPPLKGALASGPASYVIDLRGYHPPTVAKGLSMPLLILQGERDYQVTMADFAAWRQALSARSDARLVSYPGLNHLFMAGEGKSTPAEYQKPGHVDAAVIDEIAKWVTGR